MTYAKSVFTSFANTSVTVANLSTRGEYGAPTYATGVSYNARVAEVNKMVPGPDSREVLVTHRIWILSTKSSQSAITSESSVTLSGESVKRKVARVIRPPDKDGLHHTVLELGE